MVTKIEISPGTPLLIAHILALATQSGFHCNASLGHDGSFVAPKNLQKENFYVAYVALLAGVGFDDDDWVQMIEREMQYGEAAAQKV